MNRLHSRTGSLQVGKLKDMYHFVLPARAFDYKKKDEGLSDLEPLYHVNNALQLEANVSQGAVHVHASTIPACLQSYVL